MRLICLSFLMGLVSLFFMSPAWAQADLALYRVEDVRAVMTAPSAAQARDEAIIQAQHQALGLLVKRLGAEGASEGLSDETVGALVQAFDLQKEHVSPGRYEGTFTVQFRPVSVRALLDKQGRDYTATQSRPVVILPVMHVPTRDVLWEERTPWNEAWLEASKATNLVPLIVPQGDLEDIAIISTKEALSGDPDRLQKVVEKYEASGVVVALLDAMFDATGALEKAEIKATVYDMTGKEMGAAFDLLLSQDDLALRVIDGDVDHAKEEAASMVHAILKGGAQKVIDDLTERWKRRTKETLAIGPVLTMPVTVRVPDLAAWTHIQGLLSQTPEVARSTVVTMTRGKVHIELAFKGDIPSLKKALEEHDLELGEVDAGQWEIKME